MKLPALLALCCMAPALARAHVGSPNVFFEGKAGPYAVRVSIRPPPTLPGAASVDVHVGGGEGARVTVRPVFWLAGAEGAPPASDATRVEGGQGLYHTALWLLRSGSYQMEIAVEGPAGAGVAIVPLNAAATRAPVMPPALGAMLAILALLLAGSGVAIVRAAAREATLPPGDAPGPVERASGRRAALVAAIAVVAALAATGFRWRAMDRQFREVALDRPVAVEAAIRTEGMLRLLRLTPAMARAAMRWDNLVTDHGKLMHLFLVQEPLGAAFAHLHPVRREGSTFESVLPPMPAGDYGLYAEITGESGLSQTLIARLPLPAPIGPALPPQADAQTVNEVWCRAAARPRGNAAQPYALDADDSWHLDPAPPVRAAEQTQVAALPDGSRMVFENAGRLMENQETALRFAVYDAEGRRAALQPYIGMLGHAVVRRSDGTVFTHLHPAGTISMAAQEIFAGASAQPMQPPEASHAVTFPYAFPRAGEYRIWVQARVRGKIVTGRFDAEVRAAP